MIPLLRSCSGICAGGIGASGWRKAWGSSRLNLHRLSPRGVGQLRTSRKQDEKYTLLECTVFFFQLTMVYDECV